MMSTFGFSMRFHIAMERATISYDYQRKPTLQLCPSEGEVIEPCCEEGDGYSRQIAHFARRIGGQSVPPISTLRDSWDSLRIVLAECESARGGQKVTIDAGPKECCHGM